MHKTDVYLFIQFNINDIVAFSEYANKVSSTVSLYGGKVIGFQKQSLTLTPGATPFEFQVIQVWPNREAVELWYNSLEYAPLKKLRDEKAIKDLSIYMVDAIA